SAAGTQSFSGLTQVFSPGVGYLHVTADAPCAAIPGRTININAINTSNLIFASGTPTGSSFSSGGQQTIAEITPLDVTSAVAYPGISGTVDINCTIPPITTCYNDVMLVASTSHISAVPTGNGSLYSNPQLSYGTAGSSTLGTVGAGGGYVVYKGTL